MDIATNYRSATTLAGRKNNYSILLNFLTLLKRHTLIDYRY